MLYILVGNPCFWGTFCLFQRSRWRQQFLQMFVPIYQTMWHHIHYQEEHKPPIHCFSKYCVYLTYASTMFWVFRPHCIYCSGYMTVFWDTQWHSWWRHCSTSWKVTGLIPDGVVGILHWLDPSSYTVALGLIQPLTEMSTRSTSWGVKVAGASDWQPCHFHVPLQAYTQIYLPVPTWQTFLPWRLLQTLLPVYIPSHPVRL